MAQALAPLNRVVVTGVGAISPLGLTLDETWNNMIAGYSAVKKNEIEKYPNLPVKIAAKIPRIDNESTITNNDPINNNNPPNINIFDPKNYLRRKESFYTDPNIQYALTAAAQAMQAAKLDHLEDHDSDIDRYRIGVSFASALGGLESFETDYTQLKNDAFRKISPYNVSNRVINTSASAISLRYGLRGPNLASATACSASAHAIQTGYQLISSGYCDICVVGGTEAAITPTFIAGLCRCKALAVKYNDTPCAASRPWDKDRNGFVMGEGAACLVLESEQMALQRGISDIYGEIVGIGATADAFHCTGLDPSGEHVRKCMQLALDSGKQRTGDKDLVERLEYINAHATSTDIGDKTELKAILGVFSGCDMGRIKISGTKSSIGHLMGGSGAMEAVITLKALQTKIAPPTINLENVDSFVPEHVNLVANEKQMLSDDCKYGMSNSFGFGGTNASLLFRKRDSL